MISFLFFLFATVAIVSAIIMVVHRNPVYSALFLILTMFCVAGFYVLLSAPFIAAVHMIVYAGAIMVLFLFVIMLLDLRSNPEGRRRSAVLPVLGGLVAFLLVGQLGYLLFSSSKISGPLLARGPQLVGSTRVVGEALFTKYLFPFEVASVLLLSAIIGSVILAKLKLKS